MKIFLILPILFVVVSAKSFLGHLSNWKIKIIGGVEVQPNEIPSIVNAGQPYCGATIIHPKWALTAAHCSGWASLKAVAGDHDMFEDDGTEQIARIKKFIPHESFGSPTSLSNDIALIELETGFTFNENVTAAKLAPRKFVPRGDAMVAGWGVTEDEVPSERLLKVIVPLVSDEACTDAYGSDSIDKTMMCAGTAGRDACQTDSGGPLFCDNHGEQVHCGVVSWGNGCGLPGYPGVYARTSYFIDWIEENTGLKF